MRHRPARRDAYQTELFETETDRPSWQDLPARTREALTSLVAQLLLAGSQPGETRLGKEAAYE